MADDYEDEEGRGGTSSKGGGGGIPVGGRILIGAAAVLTVPVTIAVTVLSLLAVERRRVRNRWWVLWTATSAVVALTVSGSPLDWLLQPLRLPAWLLSDIAGVPMQSMVDGLGGEVGQALAAAATSSLAQALLGQLLFGLPVGFAITAVYTRVRRFKREKLGEIEGPEFSNHRPVGILDRRRADHVARQMRAGHYTFAPEPAPEKSA
ncbi:hypothetical protein [Prescottella agglutinans]|uniref:Uncharacterized protein n=1 Tax=Prescottella agglutinans TaxID=1644129 RepID=A0ABT6MJU8_9NOCA|nr:hypothetical protein [Prescottella agglutinans]MDH6284592.1 hypothetical protein [Prescottella agglutinans]